MITIGTVRAVPSGGMVSVSIPGQVDPVLVPATRDVASAVVGDTVVVVIDQSQMWAVGLLGTAPPPPPPVEIEPEVAATPPRTVEQVSVIRGTQVLTPTWTGTWRAGAWRGDTSDLFQGDFTGRGLNQGAAFIDGADAVGRITAANLHIEREPNAGATAAQTPTIVLLGSARSNSAFPSVISQTAGPALAWGASADWALPAGWLTHLQSGAATGLGIRIDTRDPYMKLAGSRLWLTVSWERTR